MNKKKSKVRPKSQKPTVNVQLDEVDRREKKPIKHEYRNHHLTFLLNMKFKFSICKYRLCKSTKKAFWLNSFAKTQLVEVEHIIYINYAKSNDDF